MMHYDCTYAQLNCTGEHVDNFKTLIVYVFSRVIMTYKEVPSCRIERSLPEAV